MNDRNHFEEYREQTRIKHEILEKYLNAFLHILKKMNRNLIFIDGFAGPGIYKNGNLKSAGSPLRALNLISSHADFAKKVATIFIEKDKTLFETLNQMVSEFYHEHSEIREPKLINTEFRVGMEPLLQRFEQHEGDLAPTFLFVDPCGVSGVFFDTMARLMNFKSCEIFLFFNIDGLRRILGLGSSRGSTLAEFLGSDTEADDLQREIHGKSPAEKENAIVAKYFELVRKKMNAEYITGFRIEKENQRTVSHYLIHITAHKLGFRIMKSIMWKVGRTEGDRGGLALIQKSSEDGPKLFDPEWDTFKKSILSELTPCQQASYFYEDLTEKPDNYFCEPAYREALLELEKEGKVLVIDKNGKDTTALT
ncbi:three-Cys-motif partner protein TcmP, partial [Acaryochloris marina NIES-2412]|uniref:three-Cys-motif partner protein TcmP n=1 Tax=Acaryochloris marina TaxID=155978 RepID=UPI004059EE27